MKYPGSSGRQTAVTAPAQSVETAIEDSVDAYFADHSEKIVTSIRSRMEEEQARIIDSFCQSLHAQYLQRIEALEASAHYINETLSEIRASDERTGDDVRNMAAAIGGLIEEMTKARSAELVPRR
jgi:uncharacterized protein (UPF0335 family)